MSKKSNSSGGIGFFGMLTIVFIALKLMGYISWSWWLILLPIYGWVALGILIILAMVIIERIIK